MSDQGKIKLTRRDFLRAMGLGAGAVAVTATASPLINMPLTGNPSFEAGKYSDPAARPQRPWWVRTVDKPTIEIDWEKMKRYNEGYKEDLGTGTVRGKGFEAYVGTEKNDELNAISAKTLKDGILNNVPGYTLKDQALKGAQDAGRVGMSFVGPQKAKTPEEKGVPKWTGSPEEGSRILRAAFRHMGAATVGFVELNENTKKLIYSFDPDGKELIFTDDPEPSETETQRLIPNTAKSVLVYTIQMSEETLKRAPTPLGQQTTGLAYKRHTVVQAAMQEFLRGMGYMGMGSASINALGIAPAFGVLAGLGEMSRLNRMITPEFGPMVRCFIILTDMPVAFDKPIDAGVMEFCKRCKKCAEACATGALSFDDEPSWEIRGPWNNPGHKAYFEDSTKCMTYWREVGTNCGICFSVCPFSKKDKAWIHEWVKATASAAPVMDGFMRSMDDAFGYGAQKDCEEWWQLDLPEYGTDSSGMIW